MAGQKIIELRFYLVKECDVWRVNSSIEEFKVGPQCMPKLYIPAREGIMGPTSIVIAVTFDV